MQKLLIAAMLVFGSFAAEANAGFSITDGETFASVPTTDSTYLPYPITTASVSDGGYFSSTTAAYLTPGSSASLSVAISQTRPDDGAVQGLNWVNFTSTYDMNYALSASYTNTAGFGELFTYLLDLGTSEMLFLDEQTNIGPFTFVSGVTGSPEGPTSGILLAGHEYQWYVLMDSNFAAGTGSGIASLSLSPTAVPESSSVFVWALLGLTIGATGWYGRKLQA